MGKKESLVYIPQQPARFDANSGLWIPSVDMDAAKRFGEFVIMLPPGAGRLGTAPLVEVMKEKMANFTRDDYLVAVGDPALIAAASAIATRLTGGFLRLLKWDRRTWDYVATEIKV